MQDLIDSSVSRVDYMHLINIRMAINYMRLKQSGNGKLALHHGHIAHGSRLHTPVSILYSICGMFAIQ